MRRHGGAGERRGGNRGTHPPRAAAASGQTAERQHLDRHLADKWSQRELKGAREAVGPPLPPCPASPGGRPARGAAPTAGTPNGSPPVGPELARDPPLGSGKGRAGLRSWQASGEGLITGKTLIPQSGFSFLFL